MAETTMAYGEPDPVNPLWFYASTPASFSWKTPLTAAAVAPIAPPREWFETPEPDHPTPITYEEDGRVYGHLALWDSCHRGLMGGSMTECVKPPRSVTDYSHFHLGHIVTEEGDKVAIGKITFNTGHAPLTGGAVATAQHYDNTGRVGAYVRARDGKLGPWLSGVRRSDLAPGEVVSLRANPLSGDWRMMDRNLELMAALAVPMPGFLIPQSQLALAATADGGLEVSALILPAFAEEEEMDERDFLRQRHSLSREIGLTASVRSKDYLRRKKTISREWR